MTDEHGGNCNITYICVYQTRKEIEIMTKLERFEYYNKHLTEQRALLGLKLSHTKREEEKKKIKKQIKQIDKFINENLRDKVVYLIEESEKQRNANM